MAFTRRRKIWLTLLACAIVALVWWSGPGVVAYSKYEPQEGDIIVQSLPAMSDLVTAIEGCTESPWSHCGIVAREDGEWVVYEAIGKVRKTPLWQFWLRSRHFRFAVYRFKQPYRKHIPATLKAALTMMGRRYDIRYRMDDERIYCSELIWKAYREATGEELGKIVTLGELNWKPHQKTIEKYEQGPVPRDRKMITPRDLVAAEQLVFVLGCRVPRQ